MLNCRPIPLLLPASPQPGDESPGNATVRKGGRDCQSFHRQRMPTFKPRIHSFAQVVCLPADELMAGGGHDLCLSWFLSPSPPSKAAVEPGFSTHLRDSGHSNMCVSCMTTDLFPRNSPYGLPTPSLLRAAWGCVSVPAASVLTVV